MVVGLITMLRSNDYSQHCSPGYMESIGWKTSAPLIVPMRDIPNDGCLKATFGVFVIIP
jgi:hypothetical protein